MSKIIRASVLAAASTALVATALVAGPADQAQASANRVINASNSDGSLNVFTNKDCTGTWDHIWPNQQASLKHTWRSVYVPVHGAIRFYNKTWGNEFVIENNGDWRKCTLIGTHYSPFGFRMTYYRNN